MAIYDKYTKKSEHIERREVVGPMSKGKEVMDALHADGFRLIRSGPYTSKKMWPKVDVHRFLFIAERESQAPESEPPGLGELLGMNHAD